MTPPGKRRRTIIEGGTRNLAKQRKLRGGRPGNGIAHSTLKNIQGLLFEGKEVEKTKRKGD